MRRWPRPAPITWLLLLAALALLVALGRPTVTARAALFDYLFVVDITQSMLVRDYLDANGQARSRLQTAKTALKQALEALPCGSRVGVGLFTGWQAAIAFRPIEVCRHQAEISAVIERLDWRMTWAPQSNIARGLFNTLDDIAGWQEIPTLVFVTDGDEAPAIDPRFMPELPIERGTVSGLVVGTGATLPSPIPKYSLTGEPVGVFKSGGKPLLSGLAKNYLEELAATAGLDYHSLRTSGGLADLLSDPRYARAAATPQPLSWLFAGLALALLAGRYVFAPGRSAWNPVAARAGGPGQSEQGLAPPPGPRQAAPGRRQSAPARP